MQNNKSITFKVTITDFTLKELKDIYREHYGYPKTERVTKQDIAIFIAILFESDAQSIFPLPAKYQSCQTFPKKP